MHKNKRLAFSLIGAASAVVLVGLFLIFNGKGLAQQGKQTATVLRTDAPAPNQRPPQPTAKELDDAATPIVDLDGSSAYAVTADRALKNARYDKHGLIKNDLDSRAVEFSIAGHGQGDISDLPTDKSDLVVEGKVVDSAAFLSNDKSGVYSEFTIRVTDVLKKSSDLKVRPGAQIVTERIGGRVRYPDGRIVRYSVNGQGSPMKGKNYLFFLSKTEQDNYRILTAYELQGEKVMALDGSRLTRRGGGTWGFDKHNEEDYLNFRESVGRAIKNPAPAAQNRRTGP